MVFTTPSLSAFYLIAIAILGLLATFGKAHPQNMMIPGLPTPKAPVDDQFPNPDLGLPPPLRDTVAIKWGNQSRPASVWFPGSKDSAAPLRSSTCIGHHGVTNNLFDRAVQLFCQRAKNTILDLDAQQNSIAMTYTYWPPAKNPNFKPIGGSSCNDCGETGQVHMHIGFGLGAPNTKYTLSEYACVRGLQRVYNNDCDASHRDNKHGGQLDLGTFVPPLGPDPGYKDHLLYLADPNPPPVGRNSHCSNGKKRFVPNLENTKVLEEWVDECIGQHLGFGGDDPWDVMPEGWTNWVEDWKVHEGRKKDCSERGGIYDKKGGTGDNV